VCISRTVDLASKEALCTFPLGGARDFWRSSARAETGSVPTRTVRGEGGCGIGGTVETEPVNMAKKKVEKRKTSSTLSSVFLALSVVVSLVIVGAIVRSHIAENRRAANVYYGSVADFSQPVCVVHQRLLEATPEYQELRALLEREEVDRDDPEAAKLLSDAADRVADAISTYAKENGYDLVAEADYWEKHAPRGTAAGDVTEDVIELIRRESRG
jgi:nucleotide-binding universal stress UspA family protein